MNDASSAGRNDPRGDSDTDQGDLSRRPSESLGEEAEILRRRLDTAQAEADGLRRTLQTRQRELDQLRATLTVALTALRHQLESVERSTAWRYGHATARALSRVRGRRPKTAGGVVAAQGQVDRILGLMGAASGSAAPDAQAPYDDDQPEPAEPGRRRATRAEELLLGQRVRDALGPPPPLFDPPSIAAVVVSRSAERSSEVLEHLTETAYPSLEVVLIDNASAAGEVTAVARGASRLPVRAERLDPGVSFAQASNRGAELTKAEMLLFLNDDIRPVEPGWLLELVSSLQRTGAQIAGATLVDPLVDAHAVAHAAGWRLEQRGITIGLGEEGFTPVRRESGEDVLGRGFSIDSPAAAVSGACLMMARSEFETLGGFDTGYHFGLEDIDLCLRARAGVGSVTCSGRAILVHGGSTSQAAAGREFRRINRAVNRRRFRELWGPALRRDRLEGLLRSDPAWGAGPHVAIARTSNDPGDGWGDYYTGLELGEALGELGWQVTYLAARGDYRLPIPSDLDVGVVLTDSWDAREFPPATLMVAWIRNWTDRWLSHPWLDRYDVLLASSRRSMNLIEQVTGRRSELFPLATNPARFSPPPPGSERTMDWVVSANRWGEERAIENALTGQDPRRGAIYGRGWERVRSMRSLTRGPIAYERLPEVYRTAKVVVDDTAGPTRVYEAVNARVFDALACGAAVLTDGAAGVEDLFGDDFPSWESPEQLAVELRRLLETPDVRTSLAARHRDTVLREHTYERRAGQLRRLLAEQNQKLSFCLKIGAPDWEQAERWGDLHFAQGLGRALRRLGHGWRVDTLPEWEGAHSATFDVALHLRGRSEYRPNPGQFNVLWLISHPETFDERLADGFDLVCVASAAFAAHLTPRIRVPVRVLDQATDPRVFFPDPDSAGLHDLVFVGNSRGVRRKILDDLLPTELDLGVWGLGWQGTPAERHLVADHVPNEDLRKVYSSARVVLCDHWPDMRAAGFRSNRLYDALACEAMVVCDPVAGLEGSLGDAVVTYDDPAELPSLLHRLIADGPDRERRARQGRELILAGETFDHRARDLLEWIEEIRRAVPHLSPHGP